MCTVRTMTDRIKKLQQLEAQIAELTAQADKIKESVKADMSDVQEMRFGSFIIRYKYVFGSRLDSKALQQDHPEIYEQYKRTTATRRFSIA